MACILFFLLLEPAVLLTPPFWIDISLLPPASGILAAYGRRWGPEQLHHWLSLLHASTWDFVLQWEEQRDQRDFIWSPFGTTQTSISPPPDSRPFQTGLMGPEVEEPLKDEDLLQREEPLEDESEDSESMPSLVSSEDELEYWARSFYNDYHGI